MTPRPLDRKLGRDLWRLKWQVMAIALLIGCGVALAVMSYSAQGALMAAQDRFYQETRFAQVFANVRRAPLSRVTELGRIEGVTAVDPRIVASGLMHAPGLMRPATARMISLPDDGGTALNGLWLTAGRMPDPARTDEAVALKTFLEAAHIGIGSRLTAVIGGRTLSFTVVGAALSPEYIYLPSPGSFMPDDAHQGVFWATRRTLERAAGDSGAFNTVSLDLAPGTSVPATLAEVNRILGPYGGRAAYGRTDQPSHAFLTAELKELSTSASILPPIFLVVAAALVHLVISRLVDAEREQIGLLKAFGYSDREAGAPYLKLAAAIGLIGSMAGGLVGATLGAAIVDLYREYFRFPVLTPQFHWPAFLAASAVAVASVLIGATGAYRRAAALSPAVAMQPVRPAAYRRGLMDHLLGHAGVDEGTRMLVRNLERFPGRAVMACLGLAASFSLLIGTQFLFDSLDEVVDQAYYRSQRWSEAVGFAEPRGVAAARETLRLPGVIAAEPVRAVTARLMANTREEMVRVVGLDSDAELQRPLDAADRPVPFLGSGLVLSEGLAARLGLRPGDVVRTEVIDGRAPAALLPVTGLANDFSGFAAYMDRRQLNRLMGEGDVISGAQLIVAADARTAYYAQLEAIPQIIASASRDDAVAGWRQAMQEAFSATITYYVAFAAAIAFGVAYNTSRISLSERARDLATLRVLGFGPWSCAYVLAGELMVLALMAIPVGIGGGQALAHLLVAAYSREDVRLPAVIHARSYGIALAAYLAAVVLAASLVTRRIWTFDLVEVLKTRE